MKKIAKVFAGIMCVAAVVANAQNTVGLKDVYANKFKFGNILNGTTVNNQNMKTIVLREFNSITPENELKPDQTIVCNGSTNTNIKVQLGNGAKNILQFCQDNNIPVRGHTLVWHSQTPQCFFKSDFTNNGSWVNTTIMDQRMESYIKNMFDIIKTSYPNLNLYAYDVVNEAASENGSYRTGGSDAGAGQSMWVQVYGNNSFVEKAFTYARKYAPATTKLFYNDYNEYITAKMNYIASSIVQPLYTKGLLDGMGMQSHLDVRTGGNNAYPTPATYGAAVKKYKDIGVEIHVTELDATLTEGGTDFTAQATYYENIMKAIMDNGGSSVTAVVVWGIQDDQSWRKSKNPLLFNSSGQKKAAYNSLYNLIPQSQWGGSSNSAVSSSSLAVSSSSSRPSSSSLAVSSSSSRPSSSSLAVSSSSSRPSSSSLAESSSSEAVTPIQASNPQSLIPNPPTYYTLKGEPLGSKQPNKPGVYIVKSGYSVKKVVVK